LPKKTEYDGMIAVLTRATIRLNKLSAFWKNVETVSSQMRTAKGFITSVGIGEVPFIKQATFSIWQSKEYMKQFAYNMQQHAEVIKKTRKENWYSEEMFVRFKIVASSGSLRGKKYF
jgi:heme-degrading monooxygenase HmoA